MSINVSWYEKAPEGEWQKREQLVENLGAEAFIGKGMTEVGEILRLHGVSLGAPGTLCDAVFAWGFTQ